MDVSSSFRFFAFHLRGEYAYNMPAQKTGQNFNDPKNQSLQRRADNEVIFEKANDVIAKVAQRMQDDPEEEVRFLCECSDSSCAAQVEVTVDEYKDIRRRDNVFILLPRHDDPRIENIVDTNPRFVLVQKKEQFQPS
jgi:hypothetical protein